MSDVFALLDRDGRDWTADAACAGVDPDLFFPERGESVRQAKAVCARCPVRLECLNYAMANGEKFGIWGGMSERERRRVRRQRRLSIDTPRSGVLAIVTDGAA